MSSALINLKAWVGGGEQPNIQKHFRSLCDCCFSPQAISALMHANGGPGYENFMPCLTALSC